MKHVTAWYRWTVDSARPLGYWEFNHIEDGHCESSRPTPKVEAHEKMWKGGEWFGVHGRLEDRVFIDMVVPGLVLEEQRPVNKHFEYAHSIRHDKKLGDVPRLTVKYKGEALAIFEGDNLEEQALEYIRVYGYLAEWTYLKYKNGAYENWTEKLRVYP